MTEKARRMRRMDKKRQQTQECYRKLWALHDEWTEAKEALMDIDAWKEYCDSNGLSVDCEPSDEGC